MNEALSRSRLKAEKAEETEGFLTPKGTQSQFNNFFPRLQPQSPRLVMSRAERNCSLALGLERDEHPALLGLGALAVSSP